MECLHQFIHIEQVTRPQSQDRGAINTTSPDAVIPVRDSYGARVGCPICGEIRVIWTDGSVTTEHHGKNKDNQT